MPARAAATSGREARAPAKPPYRIPTMVEIAASPLCGLTAISTFSGAGGSSLGLRMAGWKVAWASEFVPEARDTYRANFPGTPVDERDIRAVEPAEVLAAIGMAEGELDLMDGSPPCSGFSMSGKREAGWGKVKAYSGTAQVVDDLFFEYARLLAGIRPKVFVAENVPGLVIGKAKGYFKIIFRALEDAGYNVEVRVLDASWLGVPQARRRLIFQGVRRDLGFAPVWPAPLPYRYTVRDAIGDMIGGARVVHDTSGLYSEGDVTDRPSPTVTAGVGGLNSYHFKVIGSGPGHRRSGEILSVDKPCPTVMAHGVGGDAPHQLRVAEAKAEASVEKYAIGRELRKLKPGEQSERYYNLVKPALDAPCPTVTQTGGVPGAASVVHPTEPRKFTIAELRRICGFPDDFILTGRYQQQWERLGRAVPPPMMAALAAAIRDRLCAAS